MRDGPVTASKVTPDYRATLGSVAGRDGPHIVN